MTRSAAARSGERSAPAAGASDPRPERVGLDRVRAAAGRIRGVALRTPLLPVVAPGPSAAETRGPRSSGAAAPEWTGRVWLKCESLQPVGSFKLRGAYNFLAAADPETRAGGVLTYSSGNHARAVAYAARRFDVAATVVMPVDAPRIKLEAVRALGARVELAGTTTVERKARAEELHRELGGAMVPPFDHPEIIAGQGTVGLEIVEELAEEGRRPALVVVPVGGGGLISGVAVAVRALVPGARVVGVEPEGAPKMSRSLAAGRPVTLERVETIADGLKPVAPGALTFEHCRSLVERVVTVADEAIREGVLWCLRRGLVVEPSGAAGIAALLAGAAAPAPAETGETVVILSGGNLEPSLLAGWLA